MARRLYVCLFVSVRVFNCVGVHIACCCGKLLVNHMRIIFPLHRLIITGSRHYTTVPLHHHLNTDATGVRTPGAVRDAARVPGEAALHHDRLVGRKPHHFRRGQSAAAGAGQRRRQG